MNNNDLKGSAEYSFWEERFKSENGKLGNRSYEYFFTKHFNIEKDYFINKRILDIGCGPRGSLEWADGTLTRVGLDPLANSYMDFGIANLKMTFVCSGSEYIPFPDNYFDVISSFNSLDHVDDLEKSISQIKLKLKLNGLFLLITDVNHKPTPTEPVVLGWDIITEFAPEFRLIDEQHYEKHVRGIYQSILENKHYDHDNNKIRYGILSAKFVKIE